MSEPMDAAPDPRTDGSPARADVPSRGRRAADSAARAARGVRDHAGRAAADGPAAADARSARPDDHPRRARPDRRVRRARPRRRLLAGRPFAPT